MVCGLLFCGAVVIPALSCGQAMSPVCVLSTRTITHYSSKDKQVVLFCDLHLTISVQLHHHQSSASTCWLKLANYEWSCVNTCWSQAKMFCWSQPLLLQLKMAMLNVVDAAVAENLLCVSRINIAIQPTVAAMKNG